MENNERLMVHAVVGRDNVTTDYGFRNDRRSKDRRQPSSRMYRWADVRINNLFIAYRIGSMRNKFLFLPPDLSRYPVQLSVIIRANACANKRKTKDTPYLRVFPLALVRSLLHPPPVEVLKTKKKNMLVTSRIPQPEPSNSPP
jgi:hypothetical protein